MNLDKMPGVSRLGVTFLQLSSQQCLLNISGKAESDTLPFPSGPVQEVSILSALALVGSLAGICCLVPTAESHFSLSHGAWRWRLLP